MSLARIAHTFGAVVVLALVAAACEPAPPAARPSFTASGNVSGADVAPGDGICATANGGCSLQAAIDEANALGRARVVLGTNGSPAGTLTVTGDLEIDRPVGQAMGLSMSEVGLRVAVGARLRASNLGTVASLWVGGTAMIDGASFGGTTATAGPYGVEVNTTGTAMLHRVDLVGWNVAAVRNAGTLALSYTTIYAGQLCCTEPPDPALMTTPTGTTTIGATLFIGDATRFDMVPACGGMPPTSRGWNLAYDDSCALSGPGDRSDGTVILTGYDVDEIVDEVPSGSFGCTEGAAPAFGVVPAFDSDDDDRASCEIGEWQDVV